MLVACPECGHKLSSKAPVCFRCGYKQRIGHALVALAALLFTVYWLYCAITVLQSQDVDWLSDAMSMGQPRSRAVMDYAIRAGLSAIFSIFAWLW